MHLPRQLLKSFIVVLVSPPQQKSYSWLIDRQVDLKRQRSDATLQCNALVETVSYITFPTACTCFASFWNLSLKVKIMFYTICWTSKSWIFVINKTGTWDLCLWFAQKSAVNQSPHVYHILFSAHLSRLSDRGNLSPRSRLAFTQIWITLTFLEFKILNLLR